jgi:hypothetical protein
MIAPVTVTGSVVVCFLFVEPGCANANGASSKQASVTIVLFIFASFFMSEFPEVVGAKQEPLRCFGMGHFCRRGPLERSQVVSPLGADKNLTARIA